MNLSVPPCGLSWLCDWSVALADAEERQLVADLTSCLRPKAQADAHFFFFFFFFNSCCMALNTSDKCFWGNSFWQSSMGLVQRGRRFVCCWEVELAEKVGIHFCV